MKIKYKEMKEIEQEETLLDILKLEDNTDRKTIIYETDSIQINIEFWESHKALWVWIGKSNLTLTLDTIKSTPEQVVETIESIVKISGEKYEN